MRGRTVKSIVLSLLALSGCISSSFAQSPPELAMRAQTLAVSPSALTGTRCVQVGVFFTVTNLGANQDYSQVNVVLDYSLTGGAALGADPVARISDFVGANLTSQPGISNPGTPVEGSACGAFDVVNSATQGATGSFDFMPNEISPNAAGSNGFVTEDVNTVTQRITLGALDTTDFFRVANGVEYLIGVLSFPVDPSTPSGGGIDIAFAGGQGQNLINSTGGALDAAGNTSDGRIDVFEPIACSGATVEDNQGTAAGSNIEINYLDPQAGGIGGDISLTMPHGLDPDRISISPNDGSGMIILSGGQIGVGQTALSLSTASDGTPVATVGSVIYEITYDTEFPGGSGNFVSGSPCFVTVDWAPPSCEATFDPQPVVGGNSLLDVNARNVTFNNPNFGVVTTPNSSPVELVAPNSVAGNELAFNGAVSLTGISPADFGDYLVDIEGPGSSTASCSATVLPEPPVNETSCAAIDPATIGGAVDIPLTGNDGAIDFTVIYNGVTFDNLPAGTFALNNIVGNNTSVLIRANGFDAMGNPVTDDINCSLDFAPPTCSNPTQDPDSSLAPVDPGTVLTLGVDSTNAVSALVNGGPMTPDVDPDSTSPVSWEASFTATQDESVDVRVTNPDGEFTDCSWTVDVNQGVVVSPTSGLTTSESGISDTFDVVLQGGPPSSDVTINLSSDSLDEGTIDVAQLVFNAANFDTPQTVTVTGVDDAVADGDIGYSIVLDPTVSADGAFDGLDPTDVSVTNTDNDAPAVIVDPSTGLVTSEDGATDRFTLVLNGPPSSDVIIDLSSSDPSEGTVSPPQITFIPANWDVPQEVMVTGVDDSEVDGNTSYTIISSVTRSDDPDFDGLEVADVQGTNTDNDFIPVPIFNPLGALLLILLTALMGGWTLHSGRR